MPNLGIGVMINMLGGNEESVNALQKASGKEIASAELAENSLSLKFSDGSGIRFWDNGQSCCESRYMVCDDNLLEFTGQKFIDAELKDGANIQGEYGDEHEVQFLRINTTGGAIVCSNHNEHNGYYGGFSLKVSEL